MEVSIDDLDQDTLWRLNAFVHEPPAAGRLLQPGDSAAAAGNGGGGGGGGGGGTSGGGGASEQEDEVRGGACTSLICYQVWNLLCSGVPQTSFV